MKIKEKDKEEMLKCVRCSYWWIPRKKPEDIRECPACKSRDWRGKE